MKKKVLLLVIFAIVALYNVNAPKKDFFDIYTNDDQTSKDLKNFMQLPTKSIEINGVNWKYLKVGLGKKVILFSHGMGGAYNLWWQQVKALENDYTIITFSLPEEIDNLEDTANGLLKILDTEMVEKFYMVGASMGGYITQYMMHKVPHRIEKAVLSNTFSQNKIIAATGEKQKGIITWIPEYVIAKIGNKKLENELLPAAHNSNLLRAILSYLPFSKKQFINRFGVVIDPFYGDVNSYPIKRIDTLIIESDNDPLIVKDVREILKEKFPQASLHTFHNQGHFPYVNVSDEYNQILINFFNTDNPYVAVEDTINNRYIKGRKTADLNLLSSAFDATALLYTSVNDNTMQISLEDYFNKVTQDGPLTLQTEILSGNIENGMANFRVAFNYPDKTYIDNLVLLEINGTWKIINKTFMKTQSL